MRRTSFRIRLCATLLCCNIVFIWGNSLLPGEVSAAISSWVKNVLGMLFSGLPGDPHQGHGLLRKLAHFTEFTFLGVLFSWLFTMLGKKWLPPLLCGFLVACVDETIQCFVPDRGPAVKDVAIDTAGVLFGIVLLLAGSAIYVKRKNIKFLEETKQ